MVKLNLSLLTVQPVPWEDEEDAAGWGRGLSGHTVLMVELWEFWRWVTESFLKQKAERWQRVFQSVLAASGVAHGSNIWVDGKQHMDFSYQFAHICLRQFWKTLFKQNLIIQIDFTSSAAFLTEKPWEIDSLQQLVCNLCPTQSVCPPV